MSSSDILRFGSDASERVVVGLCLSGMGAGALAFWNIGRDPALWLMLLAGSLLVLLGLVMLGLRRVVALERREGVVERLSLYGLHLRRRHWPSASFDTAGSQIAGSDSQFVDVVLYPPAGVQLALKRLLGDDQARREIAALAAHLTLPAESAPRARRFLIG